MDDLSFDKKAEILISALEERYVSIRTIRERVQGFCLWSLGLLTAAAGWIVQSNLWLRPVTFVLVIIFSTCAFCVLRFRFFRDLETGFRKQLITAARIEKALNLYESSYYSSDKHPMYPLEWAEAGGKNGHGNYFSRSYELLLIGLLFFSIALALKTSI